jgi:hypothetical protein
MVRALLEMVSAVGVQGTSPSIGIQGTSPRIGVRGLGSNVGDGVGIAEFDLGYFRKSLKAFSNQ